MSTSPVWRFYMLHHFRGFLSAPSRFPSMHRRQLLPARYKDGDDISDIVL